MKPVVQRARPVQRRPDVDTMFSVNADGSRNAIHPADVAGRFERLRRRLWFVLIALYLAVPWLEIGGRPVLRIEIAARHFFLLGRSFDAQDFWLSFFFVSGVGFLLFVVAALWGRAWCGFACPHTVFLEGVFRRVERWIEGPPAARRKLDQAPLRAKFVRRGAKMVVFAAIALVIAHSLLGYFMPVSELVAAMTGSPADHPTAFGFMIATAATLFVHFTWFREQLCIVVCPYGRLQGALYDQDTVLVGYDAPRGEPRGAAGTAGAGDCVDCYRCVAVCPTGIDIRNGTQMECIGCGACVDACDDVMGRLGRQKGLVRFDSKRGSETGQRRFWRGRVALYGVMLAAGVAAFLFSITQRHQFEAALSRARGTAYTVEDGRVHNVFELHVTNKLDGPRMFRIVDGGPDGAEIVVGERELRLEPLQDRRIPVHVFVPRETWKAGLRCELVVRCDGPDGELSRPAAAPLLGPSGAR